MSTDARSLRPLELASVAQFCDDQHRRVVHVIFGIVGDRHVAEDLAQETFVRVHLHWDRVQLADSPHAWVARVASNLANSWWRRRYAEARANRRHGDAPSEAAVVETADNIAVRAAVASLPSRQRTVISLRYFGGLSVAETASAMRCREGTVKSLTSKAISHLRSALEDGDGGRNPAARPSGARTFISTEEL